MAHWLDTLARALKVRTSRRSALKCCAAGVGGLLVALLVAQAETVASPTQATVRYPAGWNLVAGPAGSTLSGASGSIYTRQLGDADYRTFPATMPLQACLGYWAYFPSGGSLTPGTSRATCTVNLSPGNWVMVGNPSVGGAAAIAGTDQALTYSPAGGYQPASTIPVGAGAWVMGSLDALIFAPVPVPSGAPQAAAPSPATLAQRP